MSALPTDEASSIARPESAMAMSQASIDMLMPMHLRVDGDGKVLQVGPTLEKMIAVGDLRGASLFDLIEIRRPKRALNVADLLMQTGRRLALVLKSAPHLLLRGVVMPLPAGGRVA